MNIRWDTLSTSPSDRGGSSEIRKFWTCQVHNVMVREGMKCPLCCETHIPQHLVIGNMTNEEWQAMDKKRYQQNKEKLKERYANDPEYKRKQQERSNKWKLKEKVRRLGSIY